MATKAFQKIYTKITQITKATCSLKATGVGYDELASVDGKLAQVVKIIGDEVTLQVFSGTEGIRTNAEVVFMGKAPSLNWPAVSSMRMATRSMAVPFPRARMSKSAARP